MSRTGNNNPDEIEREIEFGTLAEQKDEGYYDKRDEVEKGRISFPQDQLYGREKELEQLHSWYSSSQNCMESSRHVFLGGYSGTGKSALVNEFMKQVASKRENKPRHTNYIYGKFGQMKSGRPFSALSQAMNQYVRGLISNSTKEELERLRTNLAEDDITLGSEYATILSDVLIPGLQDLLGEASFDSSVMKESIVQTKEQRGNFLTSFRSSTTWTVGYNMNVIKYAFQCFIKALAAYSAPVTIFLDDLQWADDASFQLVTGLLRDKSLKDIFFVGAFRINEVGETHQLTKLMREIKAERGDEVFKKFEITNLSPVSIAEFIADSIDRDVEFIAPITDAIYTKTLGNIFSVKQALEELVRKNALYFDIICYQWQFGDVTRVELEKYVSDDVVQMVLSKLKTLPEMLQLALELAAYTSSTIHIDLLELLLSAKSVNIEYGDLQQMMDLAYSEGLVLPRDGHILTGEGRYLTCYKFAHDRIREAACALVPVGDERDQLLLCISKVLLEYGSPDKDDWMLFAAARHLNSLPVSITDPIQLAELNYAVGVIASSKGAFRDAIVFLRAGVDRRDTASCWKEHYKLCYDLKTRLMQAEHSLGNADRVLEITDEIFENAKSLPEKSDAHICFVEASTLKNNSDFVQSTFMALEILSLYGIHVPKSPSRVQLEYEKFLLSLVCRSRSWSCVAKYPIATDPRIIASVRLAGIALVYATTGQMPRLAEALGSTMLRIALLNQVITKDLPFIFGVMGAILRQKEKYEVAFAFGNTGISLLERFPEERGVEFLKAKITLFSISCLRNNFRIEIDRYLDLHKILHFKGEPIFSMVAAMIAMLGYLSSSLPLNVLFESKLALLEETACDMGQSNFAFIFGLLRQCLYNLKGGHKASSNPVEVKGVALDEDVVQSKLEGSARKTTVRDISIVRLMLAVIFGDEEGMEEMLDRLDEFPIFDIILERQHIRMAYTGIAAVLLSRKSGKYKKLAKASLSFFVKLARFGSANARPVYACLKALGEPSVSAFDEAIQACSNEGILSLAALMNEQCGLMLLELVNSNGHVGAEDYLKCAIWLYNVWGASRKVQQLQDRHEFLRSALDEKAPPQLTSLGHHASVKGLARSTTASIAGC